MACFIFQVDHLTTGRSCGKRVGPSMRTTSEYSYTKSANMAATRHPGQQLQERQLMQHVSKVQGQIFIDRWC